MREKVLSICIWTYNDSETLFENVRNLLALDDDRFQIIVQDNASTDDTEAIAKTINDERLCYRRNAVNIGALPNALKSLSGIDSLYAMALVARDKINNCQLSHFIDILESSKPDMGRVELSANERGSKTIVNINPGISSFDKFAYKNLHPSGYFWNAEILRDGLVNIRDLNVPADFDFPFELIYGNACAAHGGLIYKFPLIIPQYEFFKSIKKTSTYTKKNYFFSVEKRILAFKIYSHQLSLLKIKRGVRHKIYRSLLTSLYNNVSLSHHWSLNDSSVRYHYQITENPPSKFIYISYLIRALRETNHSIIAILYFFKYCICVIRM